MKGCVSSIFAKTVAVFSLLLVVSCTVDDTKNPQLIGSTSVDTRQNSGLHTSSCSSESWTAGITEWCDGEFVYRDYVYDDFGADLGVLAIAPSQGSQSNPLTSPPGLLARTAGDVRYPAGSESTADLVKFTLLRNGAHLKARFELNALYTVNQTIAAIALDEDNDPSTGNVKLMNLNVKGADRIVQSQQGNPETNLIEVDFETPSSNVFRLWAVTAQSTGEVMNVAFRGVDEEAGGRYSLPDFALPGKGSYWEDKQAAGLGAGDISQFSALVDLSKMQAGITEVFPIGPGLHQRVYTSKYSVRDSKIEGLTQEGVPGRGFRGGSNCEQSFHFMGKYQPYAIYIPNQI